MPRNPSIIVSGNNRTSAGHTNLGDPMAAAASFLAGNRSAHGARHRRLHDGRTGEPARRPAAVQLRGQQGRNREGDDRRERDSHRGLHDRIRPRHRDGATGIPSGVPTGTPSARPLSPTWRRRQRTTPRAAAFRRARTRTATTTSARRTTVPAAPQHLIDVFKQIAVQTLKTARIIDVD